MAQNLPMEYEGVPVACLATISLSKLQRHDQSECMALLKACQIHGFFHLDLRGCGTMLSDWKLLLRQIDGFFEQPLQVKMADDCHSDTWGYEPWGTSTGVEKDAPDRYESFKVARDEIVPGGQMRKQFGKDNKELLTRYINGAHAALMTICDGLSEALSLPQPTRFADSHRDGEPSLSTLAMFRYLKQDPSIFGAGHNKHTDLGSLTFLLSEQWGLQVLSPDANRWTYVRPSSTHAVINVGDSLRFLSDFALKSAVHRVVETADMKDQHRYSIAYFLRPENNVQYADGGGRTFSAQAWHDLKFGVFRQSHAEQERASFLTGGMERGELLAV